MTLLAGRRANPGVFSQSLRSYTTLEHIGTNVRVNNYHPSLHLKPLRLPEVRSNAQGHSAKKLQSQDLKLGLLCHLGSPCQVPGISRRASGTQDGALPLWVGISQAGGLSGAPRQVRNVLRRVLLGWESQTRAGAWGSCGDLSPGSSCTLSPLSRPCGDSGAVKRPRGAENA